MLELRAGPRFGIPTGNPNTSLSIKPYLVATGALLADAPYYGGLGGGLTMHTNVGNVALDPYAEIVQQSFRNSTLLSARQRLERDAVDLWAASLRAGDHGPRLAVASRLSATPATITVPIATTSTPPTFGCRGISRFPATAAFGR